MRAADLLAPVIAAVREVGLTVVDDLDGRAAGPPPESAATITLERPFDADGVLLDTQRVQAEMRLVFRLSLRRGQAWAEMRAAELAHRLSLRLPEVPLGGDGVGGPLIGPPRPVALTDAEVTARVRLRLLTANPERGLEHSAGAVEGLRAVAHALMLPRPGVDEVILPSSLDLRTIAAGVGVLEADVVLALDPLMPEAYRLAHAAMVAALRSAGRRVEDDGSGRVVDLLDQRDPRCADLRLQSYAGWTLTKTDAVEARATFPAFL